MGIINKNKIVKIEIIAQTEGISEGDKLSNYAAGHMMGGFEGMVYASLLNDEEGATTTFKITYNNGKTKIETVKNNSFTYNKYINLLKGNING